MQKKPELSREHVLDLVGQKKKTVGGGYLTDQGALFLVASDLGVMLSHTGSEKRVREISLEQKEVSLHARILSLGPPRQFGGSDGSRRGLYSRLFVYDETGIIPITLWDKKASSVISDSSFAHGSPVKISRAFPKSTTSGAVSLSASEATLFDHIEESNSSARRIPTIDRKIIPPHMISEDLANAITKGKITSDVRRNTFRRKDNSDSFLHSFTISSIEDIVKATRVVIWENSSPAFQKLSKGEIVTLLNLRPRKVTFSGENVFELHGDDSTCILEKWQETSEWYRGLASSEIKDRAKSQPSIDTRNGQRLSSEAPFVARVLSIGNRGSETSIHCLLIDSSKRKISVTLSGDALEDLKEMSEDDVIVFRPESFDKINLKAASSKKGSMSKVRSKRDDIPNVYSLRTRLDKLENGTIVSVEVMSLSNSIAREIQTKDGLVKRTEVSTADPTGEIKVLAWRSLSRNLEKIKTGSKLALRAVEVQSYEGRRFLVLKNYSSVRVSE